MVTTIKQRPSRESLHKAYIELFRQDGLWNGSLKESLQLVVKSCANALGVNRVAIWEFDDNHHYLHCHILCTPTICTFDSQLRVFEKDHPEFFDAILNNRITVTHDVQNDRLAATFIDSYIKPYGIKSILNASLRHKGKNTGTLCIEQTEKSRHWTSEEQNYAISIADLVSQLLSAHAHRTSEERYHKVFNGIANAVVVLYNGIMVDCNQAALDLFDCSLEDFSSRPPEHFWAKDQPIGNPSYETSLQTIRKALTGPPQTQEWRHRRFDGSEFDAEVNISNCQLDGKSHLIICIKDITERKANQLKIQQLVTVQQAIFDSASYGIVSTDSQGLIQSFNHAAEYMLGYQHSEVIQQVVPTCFFDPEEINWRASDLSVEQNIFQQSNFDIITAPSKEGLPEEREWTLIRRDKSRLPALVSVSPLHSGDNQVSGFLFVISDLTERIKANEQLLNSKKEMEHRSNHDELTSLPNRSRFHDMTQTAIISADVNHHTLALMLLDLDRFKEVNDTLGHAIGDKILKEVSRRLVKLLHPNGIQLYRLGGDEFAILLPNYKTKNYIKSLAAHVHASLRMPLVTNGVSLELSGSIGVSLYPEHGDNSHSLLRCADVAMYTAKSDSSKTIFYDSNHDTHNPRRLAMMGELGGAIRENKLVLYYQPRIAINGSQKCLGCEALVRWQHPEFGVVTPAEFIPLAEMSDLIHPLGLWVIESAFAQLGEWINSGISLIMSINLSAKNLMDLAFPYHIKRMLQKYKIPPELIEIEITESTLISDPTRALKVMNTINELGISFAIDDFGTGYSSLSYLKQLPLTTLKIDQSFVRDMLNDTQDAVIVRSTIALGHSFGLEVVAEGIENGETLDELIKLKCDQAQGYLISEPVPGREFQNWLRDYNTHQKK